jgi:hypothetical protein
MHRTHNSQPNTQELATLAEQVRKHLQASANAAQNFLEHALAAGEALIHAKAQIEHGGWLKWLKSCDLSADRAENYMKLARHRAELNSARVRNLSLSAALKLIAEKKPVEGPKTKKVRPATHFDALTWWSSTSPEARSRFLDGVGLKPLLAAIPLSWRQEADQKIGPVCPRATTLLKLALSTTSTGEAFNALGAVKQALARGGYDLHDIEIHLNNKARRFSHAA